MTRRTKINFKQKILSIFFVLVSLTSIVGMVGVTAIDVDANEVINKIDNAAKVWMVASTMKRCLSDIDEDEGDMDEVKQAEFLDTEDIVVGPWFENLVGAEVDNGKISGCAADEVGGGKSMPQIFARYILGDEGKYMSEIVCGNRDVFNPRTGSGATVENCMEAEEFDIDPAKVGNVFKKYYDEYVDSQNNGYLVKWDEIGSIPGAFGYRVGYNDYMVGCAPGITGVAINDKLSANTVSVNYADGTFGRIDDATKLPTGEKTTKTDYYTVYGRNDSGLKCGEIVSYGINGFANKYSEAVVKNLASFCKRELVPTIDENIANAKEVLRPFYDQQYGNGGWNWEEAIHTYFSSIERDESAKEAWNYLNVWGLSSANALNDWIFINRINRKLTPVGYGVKGDYDTEIINSGWECRGDAGVEIGIIIDEPSDSPGGGDNYEQDACYSNASPLGWILCPVVNAVSDLGKDAYEWIESNFLQIKASIFSDADNGVESVWSQIRSFANIGFIILFLVVIVSQLTGVGIDNYGIKRILPKLVICAILINLSYIVCKVAIDVSNIVGNNLDHFFAGMGPDISKLANEYEPSGAQSFVVFGGGAVAIAIFMMISQGGIGAILMLVMAIIAAVLAILTLFVILIIRQAGVVVCVIVAPLAILCYVLPNTEKLYKKWFDLFKSLLVVYPICGLVIGVGSLLSRVFGKIAGDSGEGSLGMGFALAAMLVEVLPFFFIPTLLKGSLAAMGNIGAKVSGLSRGLSKGTRNKIKGSDAMKASKQRAFDNKVMRKAGISRKTGELNGRGRLKARFAGSTLGRVTGYERLQASRNEAADKVRKANIAAGAALTTAIATSDMVKKGQTPKEYYKDALDKAAKSGNLTAYESAIEAAVTSGQLKDKDIAAMVRATSGQFHRTVGDAGVRGNFYRKLGAKYGNGFMATDVEARTWLQMSGQLNGSDYDISGASVGDYARGGGVSTSDIKASDIQKLSGGNMAAMISAKVIDSGLAKDALSMGGLSNDKKIMLGALAAAQDRGGSLTLSSEALKASAEALANNATITYEVGGTSHTVTPAQALANLGATQDQVAMWTAPPSQNVNIRQDGKQVNPVRVTLDGSRDYGGGYSSDTSTHD